MTLPADRRPRRRWPPLAPVQLRAVAARAVLLGVLLRLAAAGFLAGAAVREGGGTAAGGNALARSLLLDPTALFLALVAVALCAIDARAAHEPVFHANLGVGARFTLAFSGVVALAAILATGAALAVFGGVSTVLGLVGLGIVVLAVRYRGRPAVAAG
jgi:hypothetical protein